MFRKIYFETVKLKASVAGISGATAIGLIFWYLSMTGAIDVLGFSGDSVCRGTVEDPCYAYINFTANEDIFLYPIDYDPWGREEAFNFDPNVESWILQRSWGVGWRTIPLNKSCTGTWCGLSNSDDTRKFSVAFREGKSYKIRMIVYKHKPYQSIKWSAFNGEIDPILLSTNIKFIDDTKYEKLCDEKFKEVTEKIEYECEKIRKIPIYENVTEYSKVNDTYYTWINITGYTEEKYDGTCYKEITYNKSIECKLTGEVKVDDDKIVKDDYYFLGVDDKGIIGDECKDSHGGGADSNCDSICQKGETCVRYIDGKFERYQ